MRINRLILITHPMAYQAAGAARWARPWLAAERRMARRWLAALGALPAGAAVAIVSGYPQGSPAMEEFCVQAQAAAGRRCLVIRQPDGEHRDLWRLCVAGHESRYLGDLRAAALAQGTSWNKEELVTLWHSRACAAWLQSEARRRGMTLAGKTLRLEGWGEEFEGCTAKYCLGFAHVLGLVCPPEVVFDMCVPGSRYVLNPLAVEQVTLPEATAAGTHPPRLYLFETRRGAVGLFLATRNSLVDRAQFIRLPKALLGATVRDKPGRRLWPLPAGGGPMIARHPAAPPGMQESVVNLVHADAGGLIIPLCTGMIFRLAKAPAYVFAPAGMSMGRFSQLMRLGEVLAE